MGRLVIRPHLVNQSSALTAIKPKTSKSHEPRSQWQHKSRCSNPRKGLSHRCLRMTKTMMTFRSSDPKPGAGVLELNDAGQILRSNYELERKRFIHLLLDQKRYLLKSFGAL